MSKEEGESALEKILSSQRREDFSFPQRLGFAASGGDVCGSLLLVDGECAGELSTVKPSLSILIVSSRCEVLAALGFENIFMISSDRSSETSSVIGKEPAT